MKPCLYRHDVAGYCRHCFAKIEDNAPPPVAEVGKDIHPLSGHVVSVCVDEWRMPPPHWHIARYPEGVTEMREFTIPEFAVPLFCDEGDIVNIPIGTYKLRDGILHCKDGNLKRAVEVAYQEGTLTPC